MDDDHDDETTVTTLVAPPVSPTSSMDLTAVSEDNGCGGDAAGFGAGPAVVPTVPVVRRPGTVVVVAAAGCVDEGPTAAVVDEVALGAGAGATDRTADGPLPHAATTAASRATISPVRTAVALPTRHYNAGRSNRSGSGALATANQTRTSRGPAQPRR